MTHLNNEQLDRLTLLLEQERVRLRQDIRNELSSDGSDSPTSLAGTVHDAGEESVADMMSEINTAVLGHAIRELRQVEAAQQRLQAGEYGYCEECGEAIPFVRLEAYPAARLCLADQQRREETRPGQ